MNKFIKTILLGVSLFGMVSTVSAMQMPDSMHSQGHEQELIQQCVNGVIQLQTDRATLLMAATVNGNVDCAQKLLKYTSMQDKNGCTALHYAMVGKMTDEARLAFVELLGPAESIIQNKDGRTALDMAIQLNRYNCIALMQMYCDIRQELLRPLAKLQLQLKRLKKEKETANDQTRKDDLKERIQKCDDRIYELRSKLDLNEYEAQVLENNPEKFCRVEDVLHKAELGKPTLIATQAQKCTFATTFGEKSETASFVINSEVIKALNERYE